MPTSQTPFLSEILSGETIPPGKKAYFQERLRNRLYDLVIGEFLRQQHKGLTQTALATRIGKRPEVVNRLLAGPGNWTIDTISDLLLGITAAELDIDIISLGHAEQPKHPTKRATPAARVTVERRAAPTVSEETRTFQREIAHIGGTACQMETRLPGFALAA